MPTSFRYPQLVLRISLALVFLWLGINKFIQPQDWATALMSKDIIFLHGIFDVLVAVSLAAGFFTRWFASAAAVILCVLIISHGLNEVTIRDIGIIGGLIALVLWPERTYI